MLTATSFLITFAFLLLYTTSAKVKHGPSKIEQVPKRNPVAARFAAAFVMMAALALSVFSFGTGTGCLLFFIVLMAAGGLVVMLAPLRIVKLPALLAIFAVMFLIEYFAI